MSSKSVSNKTNCSRSSSALSKHGARVVAQTPIDAKLHVDFEETKRFFDYSTSIDFNLSCSTSNVPSSTVSAYLQNMQRGSLIQPFGCIIAVDDENFSVLAYSENAPEMLDLAPHAVPSIEQQEALTFGTDVRTLFRSSGATALQKAANFGEVNLLNPILVHCKTSGYDRVMVYKFHEDEHGEVVAESRRPDLEPFLGLHYPATDIPQASRFLFMKYKVRMICDCLAPPVKINKEVELAVQLREKHILRTQTVLCDMLLRDAPVGIVTQSPNVMDLVKCDGAALYYRKKIWLLGVTPTEAQIRDIAEWLLEYHNGSTGLSTDSLMEAGYPAASVLGDEVCGMAAVRITSKDFLFWFRSHTAKEIKWGGAKHDPGDKDDGRKMHPRSSFKAFLEVVKQRSRPWEDVEMDAIHSLQLILRGSLQDEIVDESKIIVNVPLVDDRIQRVDELRAVTSEMVRLIETAAVPILAVDGSGSINGWNTKSAELTGLSVEQAIGMSLIDLVSDDSVEVVKNLLNLASQGIEEQNIEIKLKTFGPQENNGPVILVVNACCSRDTKENVVGVCFIGQDVTGQKVIWDKYTRIQGDYVGIMRSPSALIPPIFMTDEHGRCLEWNDAMQKLSGLRREEATERMLLGEVFTVKNFGCRVKDHDTLTKLRILLNGVIAGHDADKLLFGFYDRLGNYVEALLSANKRTDAEGRITGALFFLHVASPELQYAMQVQRISGKAEADSIKKLSYFRQEISKPLNGIMFMQNLMGSSNLSKEQKQLIKTSSLCQEQLAKVVDDTDIERIEECYMEMSSGEFNLGEALEVVINQVMILSQERQVQVIRDSPAEVSSMNLYGDNLRLQQVLSDFLANALHFTPAFEGSSIAFRVIPRKERIGMKMHIVHLEFRITHPAPGIPEDLIQEMFHHNYGVSREGLGLYICQKLVKIMNGTVQYLREAERSSFIILIEFPLVCPIDQ
nr:phytochrome c [Quercus suber]